jgi:hypothetical protein
MRVIGSNSPKTAFGAISVDLRASYPPEKSACEDITSLLQRLCALPTNPPRSESHAEVQRPQAYAAAR